MGQKFYVVWSGQQTGIFTDWETARRAVDKFAGAHFKSFATRAAAEEAWGSGGAAAESRKAGRRKTGAVERARRFDVNIYCDGACEPNPGDAGVGIAVYRAGAIAELWYGLHHPMGTNNTAELNALYHALRMADGEIAAGNSVEVCSDSAYALNSVSVWAPDWEKRGRKRAGGEIKNLKIIQDCYAIYRRVKKELTLTHVAGHAGTEGNELADRMAMLGAQSREKKLRRYLGAMDVTALLKMRAG